MPLPPGLALNPLTGQISGTPTVPGTYNFTLRVRDSQGIQRDLPQTIVIEPYTAPSIAGLLAERITEGTPYSSDLDVVGGTAPFTWSIAGGTLPSGLAIDSATGTISGTAAGGPYTDRSITVRVVDGIGSSAQRTQLLRYAQALSLTGDLPNVVEGQLYGQSLVRTGGFAPYTFSIASGSLPPGLLLDPENGLVSGAPELVGSFDFTMRVIDGNGAIATSAQNIVVQSSYTPVSLTGSPTNTTQDVETASAFSITPNYSGVSASGGNATITYSWARLSGSSSISAGSPTSLGTSFVGTLSPGANASAVFRLTATDGTSSATIDVTITVNNTYVAMGLSGTLNEATETVAYSSGLTRTGGKSPYTWAIASGTLPTGLTINTGTGVISGTPTDTNGVDRSLTLRVTDALGQQVQSTVTLPYRRFPVLTYPTARSMRARAFSISPAVSGGYAVQSYALQSGPLPAGLTLNTLTGVISGTPTETSYTGFAVTVRVTDAELNFDDYAFTIEHRNDLTVSGVVTDYGYASSAYASSALSAAGGHSPIAWSVASGSLPPGVTLNSSTGALSGTPTTPGNYSFTVRATDAAGYTATSAAQAIEIYAAFVPSITPSPFGSRLYFVNNPPAGFPASRTYSSSTITGSATGGVGGYTFAWTRISGSTKITADSPAAAATTFTVTGIAINTTETATFRLSVTDARGTVATIDYPVSAQYESGN